MIDAHGSAVVISLVLIMAPLLFGSGVVIGGLGWLLAAAVFAIILVIVICIDGALKSLGEGLKSHRQNGTLYALILCFIGSTGNCVAFGLAYLLKEHHELMARVLDHSLI